MKKTIYISVAAIVLIVLGLAYMQISKVDEVRENSSVVKQTETKTSPQNEANDEKVGGGSQLVLRGEADTIAIDTDISTWTTYTNDSCDFTIKFPSSYVVLSPPAICADGTDYNAQTYNVVNIANQNGCLIMQLGQQPAEGCEIHSVYLLNSEPSASGASITNSTETVDGIPAKRITSVESSAGQITVAIPYNGIWYNYLYSFASGNLTTAEQTIGRILSTIEFN